MKCWIDIKGDLIVEADSETEAFILETLGRRFNRGNSDIKLSIKPVGAYWVPENNIITLNKCQK